MVKEKKKTRDEGTDKNDNQNEKEEYNGKGDTQTTKICEGGKKITMENRMKKKGRKSKRGQRNKRNRVKNKPDRATMRPSCALSGGNFGVLTGFIDRSLKYAMSYCGSKLYQQIILIKL